MLNKERLIARLAIESLRLGVPTAASVTVLPPTQPEVESSVWKVLERSGAGQTNGIIIEGDFGSGKSHLLKFVVTEAQRLGYATSYVSISKETPLAKLDIVYRAAVSSLVYPDDRIGSTLRPALEAIQRHEVPYRTLMSQLHADFPAIAATLETFSKSRHNSEVVQAVVDFWDGSPLAISDLKRFARGHVEDAHKLRLPSLADLPFARFSAATALLRSSGFKGWLIVLDELELIAKFGRAARMKSYGSIGKLFTEGAGNFMPTFIGALTPDFRAEVFETRLDRSFLQLYSHQHPLAPDPQIGVDFIDSADSRVRLRQLNEGDLRSACAAIADVYRVAYGLDQVGDIRLADFARGQRLRTLVRRWITQWDLELVYGEHRDIVSSEIHEDLKENADYEATFADGTTSGTQI